MSDIKSHNRLHITNNYSIISKYSASKRKYYHDKNLEKLVESSSSLSGLRNQLISRGYAVRMKVINEKVTKLIHDHQADSLIVLGGGYDTLPYRLTKEKLNIIEIDLPQIVDSKLQFFNQSHIIDGLHYEQVHEFIFATNMNLGVTHEVKARYYLVSCDLRDVLKLNECLDFISKRSQSWLCPIILNEVCLCYSSEYENERIFRSLLDSFKDKCESIHYVAMQQIRPEADGQMSRIIEGHFAKMSYPLKFFPNKNDMTHHLKKLGFSHIDMKTLHDLYHDQVRLSLPYEPLFDEFEEIDSFLVHYSLVYARIDLKEYSQKQENPSGKHYDKLTCHMRSLESPVRDYASASCIMNDNALLMTGGFGCTGKNAQHRKIDDIRLVRLTDDDDVYKLKLDTMKTVGFPEDISLKRMHGQAITCEQILMIDGGRQAPNKISIQLKNIISRIQGDEIHFLTNYGDSTVNTWRHRISLVQLSSEPSLIRIGGLSCATNRSQSQSQDIEIFSFGGVSQNYEIKVNNPKLFQRHSFSLAKRDSKSLLCVGGLQTSCSANPENRIPGNEAAFLWDMRDYNNPLLIQQEWAHFYGGEVNFICDYKAIRIGGCPYRFGQNNFSPLSLIDLRNMGSVDLNIPLASDVDQSPYTFDNCRSWHLSDRKQILTIGGGGNYFVFGTHLNQSSILIDYDGLLYDEK